MTGTVHEFAEQAPVGDRAARLRASPAPGRAEPRTGPPRVGVIFNPRSHRNHAQRAAAEATPGTLVAVPQRRGDLAGVLTGFAEAGIECLVINGGDGTVRDVLTAGLGVFGENWPAMAVVPSGKTNALGIDLGLKKDWALPGVIAALDHGHRIVRRPMRVRDLDSGGELAGFVLGAGMIAVGINAGQDAHRLGAFDGLAVGVTTAWGVLQGLFGSNRNVWRRGAAMTIAIGPEGTPLPHSGHGDPARRALLLAATIEHLPFGMRPFADLTGLKLAVMDHPRRRLLAALPAMIAGWQHPWLDRNGIHRLSTNRIVLDLKERFILDGEVFTGGRYEITPGPQLSFVVP